MLLFSLLVAVGLLALLAEIFLPGGVVGAMGLLCLVAAAATAYFVFERQTAHLIVTGFTIAIIVGLLVWARYFPQSRLGRRFVSQGSSGEPNRDYQRYLHATGVAQTPLRPAGTVNIDGDRVDVVTEGAFVERGTTVRVIEAAGNRLVVRPVETV